LLALLSGIFLAGFGQVVAYPILAALSTPDDVLPKAVLYLRVYFAGMPFLMLYNFAAAILRSKGDTRRPLHTLFISGLINVSLNLFFVLGLGWGVEGVGKKVCSGFACTSCVSTDTSSAKSRSSAFPQAYKAVCSPFRTS
jgi:Na+-driven multidrug efflux pump